MFTSPQSNPIDIELNTPTNISVQHPFISSNLLSSSPTSTNEEEDALINRISSLLASHILSRQTTTTTNLIASHIGHEHETNSNLSDSAISLSTSGTTGAINTPVTSNQLSSSIIANEFDKLLQRIKTSVDNRLSIETDSNNNTNNNRMRPPKNINQDFSYSPIRSTANRRQQLLALHAVSCQESNTYDYDSENSRTSNRKHKLDLSTKSQSFDATNLSKYSCA